MPIFFAAFALAFKDLWGLPIGEAVSVAQNEGKLPVLRAPSPAICQACRALQK
jgi:hypothetical protein